MNIRQPFDLRTTNWLLRRLKKYKDGRKKTLIEEAWAGLFKKDDFLLYNLEPDLQIKLYKDSILSRMIYDNSFEKTEITFMQKMVKRGDIFLDIGANVGLFSLYASKLAGPEGKVIAFEPTLYIYNRMLDNAKLNGLTNIKAENIGLSDHPGTLKLNISENGYDGWNTFAASQNGLHSKSIDVPVNTLDKYLGENNIDTSKIAFIKIDVEGWEVPVLKGAIETLRNNNPVLMVEFTDRNLAAAGFTSSELYDLVRAQGYTWCLYDEYTGELYYCPRRKEYPYNNLIAVKNINAINGILLK